MSEVEILKSIYPDFIPSDDSSESFVRLEIPVQFEEPTTVQIVGESDTLFKSLRNLPPLILHIVLGHGYPEHNPPDLAIRCSWLSLELTSRLHNLLRNIWQHDAVLFDWVEFIRSGTFLSSLDLHGSSGGLSLRHSDPRQLMELFTAHDESARSTIFSEQAYNCAICLSSKKGKSCIQLFCTHVFCRACLNDFWSLQIQEGDVEFLGCPDADCVKAKRTVNQEDLVRIVSPEAVKRWTWLREKIMFEKDPSLVHCPMSFCQSPVPRPIDATSDSRADKLRICSACSFSFCSFCKRSWHGVNSCPISQTETVVREYLALPEGSRERLALEAHYGKSIIAKLVLRYEEEQLNKSWLESNAMACPSCELHIEKSLGCNHHGRLHHIFHLSTPVAIRSFGSFFTRISWRGNQALLPPDSYALQHVNIPDASLQPDAEAIQKLVMMAMSLHGCHISYFQADPGRWNFYISGSYQQVLLARGMILKECPIQHRVAIKVARSEILDSPSSNPSLKHEVRRRLDEIASQTLAHIAVVNSPLSLSSRTPPDGISNGGWSGLETERVCELVVTGQGDSVDLARVRLLVMLDELSGLHAEMCEIDQKLHAIVAGRKRSVLQSIQEETATNIYFPSPLQGLVGPDHPGSESPIANRSGNIIWITGEFFGVQRARDMLFQVSVNKSKSVISRDTAILPRKLDWMVTDRADDLKSIVSDNATFIQFPALGSSTSLITVYGDNRVNIQRTIRSIMQLACNYYVGSFWLLPIQFNALLPPATLNPSQVTNLLKQISVASGAEVVFKSMCFEMHGLEQEVRSAVGMVMELEMIQAFHHEIRFQIELANEHREFISGKKNGKINKIMQTTNVKIKFETFNDHNFLIDIAGPDGSVLQGLSLLQEELPAELSFHVPEAYHKRIIGVGGRSIQRIMKKYGVYVKFSNAEEFAALGGYNDNDDNVVARTPAKNAINLDNLKQSVMELVNPKDKDYINETVSIPRRYHRTLLGEKSIFIRDIETKTNSRVRFPPKELASDVVTIFGPESQVQIAAAMLLDHVPYEADMGVPPSAELSRLIVSPEFSSLVERIKRELQVSIVPNMKMATVNEDAGAEIPSEFSFKFRCQRSNSDFLVTAREMLEQFLTNHNIHLFPAPASHVHKRGDSFAEAFPHFDSKLLSTARTHHESDDLGRPDFVGDRRLRMANSSPDVKALFNSPAYIYNLEHNERQSNHVTTSSLDYWTPLPPIGSGIPHRTRHSEDAIKRGSDSLLEAKLKDELTKPRSMQNRAQSLDLTYSLSRITESRLPPDSPTTSAGETGGNSSPISATAPSFPSVYGTSISRSAVIGTAMQRPELDVDEVSRVISTLGL
ncbi:KH domain protein [Mycena indigotica]|uniref:KH domain protein n=1 Tax=Mycena indigotica TaxID=2126181 RepID=A0A8H6SWS6_9AGAR|nr:KH domain protein [Mycena indigotica]KAF7306713.1 KH domain protein [Mycena indigotica]